ncbi:hypothetical protein M3P05_04250 [Sansalvadorimonas sp. 2012CJ34-2]|uniref:Transposase n=1 Tax=Parendozoicomonas callyspongiae TaxID=2942213 RepID=A0ABT0PCQ1_9GAMM|nr:hypothetical protein [Sansalvadorimonas sp. 2012CJ34-2]MCL6269154.1 hypothetical protein [Sansalvadorimonas sp. 2012CJ34-2]
MSSSTGTTWSISTVVSSFRRRWTDMQGKKKVVKREEVYCKAKEQHPERWGSRDIRNWQLPAEVWLNPERLDNQQHCDLAAVI